MVNKPKIKGTAAETAVVNWLRDHGHPQAERRALHGSTDLGDITGTPGLCWEVKATSLRPNLSLWLRETETERMACGADYGILVVKTKGMGYSRVGQWWAVMYTINMEMLFRQVGKYNPCLPSNLVLSSRELVLVSGEIQTGRFVTVAPKGEKDQDFFWEIAKLETVNALLRDAGYGNAMQPFYLEGGV